MRDSIVFFTSPTDVVEKQNKPGARLRIGGLVKPGSVARGDNLQVRFAITDGKTDIPVHYQGIVPDLFREGQGVVAEGKLESEGLSLRIRCSPSTMSGICRAKWSTP